MRTLGIGTIIIIIQGIIQQIFLGGGSKMRCDHDFDEVLVKSSWGSEYSMHIILSYALASRGKFVDVNWVKIPSLAAIQVVMYMKTVK